MKIIFHLEWCSAKKLAFKEPAAQDLFIKYKDRISKFTPCETAGALLASVSEPAAKRDALWVCDRGPGSRLLSSEAVAAALSKILQLGKQSLRIVIGGPDGFTPAQLKGAAPELLWCFGPLTLPHELAAVVASEQIYRAWTQIKKLPYHLSHQ